MPANLEPENLDLDGLAEELITQANRMAEPSYRSLGARDREDFEKRTEALLRKSGTVARAHKRLRASHKNVKLAGALIGAFLSLSTALAGQSSGWASHNLNLGYVLLGLGGAGAFAAVILAVYIGFIDPTSGQLAPKS